jgi:hypothetical protein
MADETDATPTEPTASPDPTPAATTDATPVADEVSVKLAELGVIADHVMNVKNLGVNTLEDLALLKEEDFTSAGLNIVQARKVVNSFTTAAPVPDAAVATITPATFDILPSVPDDSSWLEALKAGGVLKVDQSSVISAVRAALAHQLGLFDIPAKLVRAMEEFADTNDEQVDPSFYALRKQLTKRNYGDIFEAIDGLDGTFVTEERKKQLFRRMDEHLWPTIGGFYNQLHSWQEAWMQGAMNPNMLAMVVASAAGGVGAGMPPGMMQPPDTGVLRDHADAVNDAINKVFAGTGVQIAAAVGAEGALIRKSLENPRLPSLIGAANRDQMLRQLGVAVNATYPRLETNLTRFVLAVLESKNQPSGNEELQYFGALYMLGAQIPWDQLGVGTKGDAISRIGGRQRHADGL